MKLRIAPGLSMPLDAVTDTFGIFGQKGSGKSSTAAVFVEQGVRAGGRFVIADPTGVWWGLMHDGIGPGLPGIVFGGEHADVPLEASAGHVVAEFVVQQDAYPIVVLDMKLMRKADRTHFMLAFLETLYHENREALHVVLDEAAQFAPTQAREGGEQIKLLGAVEDVVMLGRARGLGITMISQRFAMLNANVREQIGTLAVHRLVGALDRKALRGWIEAQADPAREAEVMSVMAKLKTAQALFWSPALLEFFGVVDVDSPQTFDSRATPKVGQRVKKPGKRAPVDLATLRARMAETIEKQRANDPGELRRTIASLERQLRERPAETVTLEVPVERVVEVPTFPPALRASIVQDYEGLAAYVASAKEHVDGMLTRVRERLDSDFGLAIEIARDVAAVAATAPPRRQARPTSPRPAPLRQEVSFETGAPRRSDGTVSGPQQKILDALAWWGAVSVSRPSLGQIAFVVGNHPRSKGFTNNLSALSTAGLIARGGGAAELTAQGEAVAVPPPYSPTDPDLQEMLYRQVGAKRAEILRLLIEAGRPVSMDDLAALVGVHPRSKGFTNNVSSLSGLGLVERRPGFVEASDLCFVGRAS